MGGPFEHRAGVRDAARYAELNVERALDGPVEAPLCRARPSPLAEFRAG